jgi:DsbC/DsbD-like thiol-disulfide interchange protein
MRVDRIAVLLSLCVLLGAAGASAAPKESQKVQASLIANTDAIVPGQTFMLGVQLKMSPHWHTYWTNPGESGQATQIKLSGEGALEFGTIQWPVPKKIDAPGGFSYGYEDEVLLMIPVTVNKKSIDSAAEIKADISWLACSGETCIEGSAPRTIRLPSAKEAHPTNQALFSQWHDRLPVSLADSKEFVVAQKADADMTPLPELTLRWKKSQAKVQFFPEATPQIAIENVAVQHADNKTTVTYKPTVYKAANTPTSTLYAVVICEDAKSSHAIRMPFQVANPKK